MCWCRPHLDLEGSCGREDCRRPVTRSSVTPPYPFYPAEVVFAEFPISEEVATAPDTYTIAGDTGPTQDAEHGTVTVIDDGEGGLVQEPFVPDLGYVKPENCPIVFGEKEASVEDA